VLIFAEAPIQVALFAALRIKGHLPVTDHSPFSGETYARLGTLMNIVVTIYGLVSVLVALFAPWVGLALFAFYVLSKVNPVTSFNRLMPRLNEVLKIEAIR
jgi:hypothetical protein